MSIGLGLLLLSVFLGCVTLYIFTRDRWNWKKILLWPSATLVVVAVGLYAYNLIPEKPKSEASSGRFRSVQVSTMYFSLKGNQQTRTGTIGYIVSKNSQGNWERAYYVNFEGGKVWLTGFVDAEPVSWHENIQGIRMGSSENAVREKFGEPSPGVSPSKDGLRRMYHYSQCNVFFQLEQNKVTFLGIYNLKVAPKG